MSLQQLLIILCSCVIIFLKTSFSLILIAIRMDITMVYFNMNYCPIHLNILMAIFQIT